MKSVNSLELRQCVFDYLCAAANFKGSEQETAKHLRDLFESQYNSPAEQKCTPDKVQRVAQWLGGLSIPIEFSHHDIVARSKKWHGVESFSDNVETEVIIDRWFPTLAGKLIELWDKHGCPV